MIEWQPRGSREGCQDTMGYFMGVWFNTLKSRRSAGVSGDTGGHTHTQ